MNFFAFKCIEDLFQFHNIFVPSFKRSILMRYQVSGVFLEHTRSAEFPRNPKENELENQVIIGSNVLGIDKWYQCSFPPPSRLTNKLTQLQNF